MSHGDGGYKLILVPEGAIFPAGDGKVAVRSAGAQHGTGPYEVIADVGSDKVIRMSRLLYDTIEVVEPQ